MRFAFTEQQLELRAAVRQVLARECTPDDLRAIAGPGGEDADPEAEALAADGGASAGIGATRRAGAGDAGHGDPGDAGHGEAGGTRTGDLGSSGPGSPDRGRSATRWAVLAEMGVTGLLVAERHGGLGLGEVELVGVLEEAGWAGVPEPLAETAALAAPLLADAAGLAPDGAAAHALIERCLPAIAGGDLVATVGGVDPEPDAGAAACTTAPGSGGLGAGAGDRAGAGTGPRTGAGADESTMATVRVVGAVRAGLLLLATQDPTTGWELHAVDAGTAWVTATPSIDGTRDLGTVAWVPSAQTLLASGRHAESLVGATVDRAAVASAAQLLGLADRMITLAADYAKERRQFGKPIGSFQAVKHHLANARVRLEFARPAVYRAADSLARNLPDRSEHASMAKAFASDAADLAARVALQVHGAIGYTWECDLHLFMKRAWALSASWGDAPTHRARVLSAAIARTRSRPG
jgi:alkylation response protein AidB-like acyl-CoA dehydrogenase